MSPTVGPETWARMSHAAKLRHLGFVGQERDRATRARITAGDAAHTRAIAEVILDRIGSDPLGAQHRAELEAAITQPRRTA